MMGLFMLLVIVVLWIIYICSKPTKKVRSNYIPVKGKETMLDGVRCKEDAKFYFIENYDTDMCPFCKNEKIFSGATVPEYCENCGASHMLGVWLKLKE